MKCRLSTARLSASSDNLNTQLLGLTGLRLVSLALPVTILALGVGCDDGAWIGPPKPPVMGRYDYSEPAWSPAGDYMAFVYALGLASEPDTCGLYLYNMIDSTGARIITSNLQIPLPVHPDISPDGRWIAFSWYSHIWKCLATGDSLVQLTTGGWDVAPAWSPTGSRIAYERKASGVHIMNSDGSGDSLVVGGGFPQWLDEQHVVYVGLYYHIYMYDVGTGVEQLLFERPADWVVDSIRELDADGSGTHLLFSGYRRGEQRNVWRLDLETSGLTRLTTAGGDQPSWSPDGSEIAYTNTQVGRIWLMGADGRNKRPLF